MYNEQNIVSGSDSGISSLVSILIATGLFSEDSRSGSGTTTVVWLKYKNSTNFYLKIWFNSPYLQAMVFASDKITQKGNTSRNTAGTTLRVYTNGDNFCCMDGDLNIMGISQDGVLYLGTGTIFYDGANPFSIELLATSSTKTVSGKTLYANCYMKNSTTNLLTENGIDCLKGFNNPDNFSANAPITDGTNYYTLLGYYPTLKLNCLFKYTL